MHTSWKRALTSYGKKVKVLYVAGNGRSGSTLLDIILGQVSGFFPVGEVRNVWDYGLVENRPCGCSTPLRMCPTWTGIFNHAFPHGESVDPDKVVEWRERFAQTKRLLPILLRGRQYSHNPHTDICDYLATLEKLYHGIAHSTGAKVIVDSSKWPTYAYLLSQIDSIELYVLHLVRDPRACAFSWSRIKETEPGKHLDLQGPVQSTSYWVVWNPAIRYLFRRHTGRYMFLRYEDFVVRPRQTIEEVVRFAGENFTASPFISDNEVSVAKTHTVEGNAARFVSGSIKIHADTEWRSRMPLCNKLITTAMTWPFLWKYGYWS